jgi:HSP20 family molecular chaperone IbpA
MIAMGTSPFHGIFSSLSQGSDKGGAFSFDADEHVQKPLEAPEPAPQSHPQVGRVAVDIYEQDDYYIIKAPIAGVRLSDIDIEVNDNVVTIRGTRRQADQVPQNQYYLQECFWGPFSRSVTLPISVDPKKIRATFNKECVLKVLVPKEEKVKIVRITEV